MWIVYECVKVSCHSRCYMSWGQEDGGVLLCTCLLCSIRLFMCLSSPRTCLPGHILLHSLNVSMTTHRLYQEGMSAEKKFNKSRLSLSRIKHNSLTRAIVGCDTATMKELFGLNMSLLYIRLTMLSHYKEVQPHTISYVTLCLQHQQLLLMLS